MYNHLTNEELLRVTPASKLEIELIQRLDCCLECLAQQEDQDEAMEKVQLELTDSNHALETLKNAIATIATEIHRCADEGKININDDFISNCRNFIDDVYQYVHYPHPCATDKQSQRITEEDAREICDSYWSFCKGHVVATDDALRFQQWLKNKNDSVGLVLLAKLNASEVQHAS